MVGQEQITTAEKGVGAISVQNKLNLGWGGRLVVESPVIRVLPNNSSQALRNLSGKPGMIYIASIQNFETGNLSGLQSRRLTDYYIAEKGDICLV